MSINYHEFFHELFLLPCLIAIVVNNEKTLSLGNRVAASFVFEENVILSFCHFVI